MSQASPTHPGAVQAEATARPWHLSSHDEVDGTKSYEIWSGTGDRVAEINDECFGEPDDEPFPARTYAALIVAAVNAYSPEREAVFQELVASLEAHELWEADLILNGDWSGTTLRLTQDQHDKLTAVQNLRNVALRRARAISPPPAAADEDAA